MTLSIQDFRRLPNAWGIVACAVLMIRQYQGFLVWLSYLILLFYWHLYISKARDWTTYEILSQELLRLRFGRGGERDFNGTYWTLNVAKYSALYCLSHIVTLLMPTRHWTNCIIGMVFYNIILDNYLVQLWLQTRIAWLARLNDNAWRWRSWVIDYSLLTVRHKLEGPWATRVVNAFWWTLHQSLKRLTRKTIQHLCIDAIAWSLIFGSDENVKSIMRWCSRLVLYHLWFYDLAQFMNPHPPEHIYMPLKDPEDIRVILLYPRLGFGKICCSLLQGPQMRVLFYEAVSYNWGSMELTHEILVDGCTRKVTRSVHEILASYSSICCPRVLWIDALCIDQLNDMEKSQQVPLMEKIYRNADFTTVFLGRSPLIHQQQVAERTDLPYRYDGILPADDTTKSHFEDTRLTFDLLKELEVLSGNALRGQHMETYQLFEHLQLSRSKRRQWGAFMRMLEHPWFRRVWVVQEVALSQRVQVRYGDESLEWDVFVKSVERLQKAKPFRLWLELEHGVELQRVEETALNNIKRISDFRAKHRPRGWTDDADYFVHYSTHEDSYGLARVLESCVCFKATDPRDQVYGLMSLCSNPVTVDYKSTAKEVYLNVAKRLINDGAVNLLFSIAGVGHRAQASDGIPGCPSWVPDWTIAPVTESLRDMSSSWRTKCRFRSGGSSKLVLEVNDDETLRTTGLRVDVIEEIGPTLLENARKTTVSSLEEARGLSTGILQSLNLVMESRWTSDPYQYAESNPVTRPPSNQPLSEALWNVLIAGQTYVNWNHSVEFIKKFPVWNRQAKTIRETSDAELLANRNYTFELLKDMADVTNAVKSYCGSRRVFVGRQGYVGLCPSDAKPGDLVYVLPGFHVPLVLRLHIDKVTCPRPLRPSAAEMVQLVGECYVHGLMDGEAMSMHLMEEEIIVV